VEEPKIKAPGEVSFSGIIPGGFGGVLQPGTSEKLPGRILTLVFSVRGAGLVDITLKNTQVLLNDGQGTAADVKASGLSLSAAEPRAGSDQAAPGEPSEEAPSQPTDTSEVKSETSTTETAVDIIPPEIFTPQIARDQSMFNGRWFLVFIAQDKGFGIDRYEIQESFSAKPVSDKWLPATSPHLLSDQNLQHYIFVRAIDKAGNERLAIFPPSFARPGYEKYLLWIIIIVVSVSLLILIFRRNLWRRSSKQKRI
jgi:hypothetical protein